MTIDDLDVSVSSSAGKGTGVADGWREHFNAYISERFNLVNAMLCYVCHAINDKLPSEHAMLV